MEEKQIFILDLSKMEKGDIILQRFSNNGSEFVRKLTNSEYSHAMLYIGNSSILHADLQGGVAAVNAQREGVENADDMVVLRLKEGVPCDMHQLIQYARRSVGTAYDRREALQITSWRKPDHEIDGATSNRQYCTKYVTMSYAAAGVKLVKDPTACTPQEILTSDKLKRVEGAVRLATPAERKLVEEESEILKYQTKVTEDLLNKVREATANSNRPEDIQTLDQLLDASLISSELDESIYQVCKGHPYFYILDKYHEIHPEEYDYDKFIEMYGKESQDVAEIFAEAMIEPDKLYRIQYWLLSLEYKKTKGKTCGLFVDLYERLVKDCAKRMTLFAIASW